ncbi:hypothetical protein KI387_025711, partial [Taxus chinensis]
YFKLSGSLTVIFLTRFAMSSKAEEEEVSFKALQDLVKPHIDSFNYFTGK